MHDNMICSSSTLKSFAKEHTVIIKSNTTATEVLKEYCLDSNIILIQGVDTKGFAENNNETFHYAEQELGMKENDHFLVLNPDVEIISTVINELLNQVTKNAVPISTINLFKNRQMTEFDNSIRKFPSLANPIKSILGIKRTDYYDKSEITSPIKIDWAAGSFLLFQYKTFKQLQGFDEKYFMYFEDVDICRRAKEANINIIYYPQFKGLHLARHSNRNLFSKTFLYYIKSTITYFFQ